MKYQEIKKAVFKSRPNRFIANVEVDGEAAVAHVKNTGRCRELLVPDCTVYLSVSDNPTRKTKYDLVAVEKLCTDGRTLLINMDSQAPNAMAEEWLPVSGLFSCEAIIRRETTYGNSRFDFYIEDGCRKCFLEVKGVTLEKDGVAMFPDAPTERGVKHINELIECKSDGYEAYILFVIQMDGISVFRPNEGTHLAFAEALRTAQVAGLKILAYDSTVTPDSALIHTPVPIDLT
jgi:sugar fermentation stimulation protein A